MAQHKVLGPLLVRLDLGTLLAGSKAGNSSALQHIAQTQSQGIFGSHNHQGYLVLLAPFSNGL